MKKLIEKIETLETLETLEQKIARKIGKFSTLNTEGYEYPDGYHEKSYPTRVRKKSFKILTYISCHILLTYEVFCGISGFGATIYMEGLGYSTWPRYIISSPRNWGKGLAYAIKKMTEEWEKHFGLDSVLTTTTRIPVPDDFLIGDIK